MLRVWFGDKDNAIYNTSVFFKNRYRDEFVYFLAFFTKTI